MSCMENWYGNAPVESVQDSLRNEMIRHQRYAGPANAESAIRQYSESLYHRQRRSSRLGQVSPASLAENLNKARPAA